MADPQPPRGSHKKTPQFQANAKKQGALPPLSLFDETDAGSPWDNAGPDSETAQEKPDTARTASAPESAAPRRAQKGEEETSEEDRYFDLKHRVHQRLLLSIDLKKIETMERSAVKSSIRMEVFDLTREEALNAEEKEKLAEEILDEIFGYGPLTPLLADEQVSDILINTAGSIWIEKNGKLQKTNVRFRDEKHLRQIIDRIVTAVGRRVDESSPMVDARLPDGSRFNAIIPPLAIDGSHVSIRKFKRDVLGPEALIEKGSLTAAMLEMLQGIVRARLNIIISGGTGSGKTTLLNLLSSFIPADERVITIEDSAELQLRQPHVVRLETKPANIEGTGEINQRQLVKNALRMRPERIILGEVRGEEAVDMLQAMNTGHNGSMATLHANTPRDAFARLETMVSMSNLKLAEKAMRSQIASAVDVVIQANRLQDGSRKIVDISEVVGMEGEVITMQSIFTFDQDGIDETSGAVKGRFRPSGIRPRFADRLKTAGIELPMNLFIEEGSQW